jgi:hypothetical protein
LLSLKEFFVVQLKIKPFGWTWRLLGEFISERRGLDQDHKENPVHFCFLFLTCREAPAASTWWLLLFGEVQKQSVSLSLVITGPEILKPYRCLDPTLEIGLIWGGVAGRVIPWGIPMCHQVCNCILHVYL